MSADKKKIASDCWKRGTEALSREQWDFAVEMFTTCVNMFPDNLMYRQTLRNAEYRMYGDNKTGARMAGARLMGVRGRIKKSRVMKDWEAVAQDAEKGLKVNPWDGGLNYDLGEACWKLGYGDIALYGFQLAIASDPESAKYLGTYADLQLERGNYNDAIAALNRIIKSDPSNKSIRDKLSKLHAEKVIDRGGYEDAENAEDVKETSSSGNAYSEFRKSQQGQQKDVAPGESPEQDLLHAIRRNPATVENYLKLADLYKSEKKLDKAEETYNQVLDVSGGDPSVRELLEDLQLDILRNNLALAKQAIAADNQDKTVEKNYNALKKELVLREIEVLSARVERYPKDITQKYELAQRYMKVREWQKAIPLLQQCSGDSRLEKNVLVALGECFLSVNNRVLARRQLEKVLDKLDPHDDQEQLKKVHYALGRICEQEDQKEQAEEYYNEILGVDYGYRDTLSRLESLYK